MESNLLIRLCLLFLIAKLTYADSIYDGPSPSVSTGKIDIIVFNALKAKDIEPANLCSDHVFIRRVFLDAIGTLPTAAEVQNFLNDTNQNKRQLLIDKLLQRPEFAEYWSMKWCDLFRVKAEFPINLWPNAAQAFYRWIKNSIDQSMPYDQFVRELLTASGSNFRTPQVNFYRSAPGKTPQSIAKIVALNFMGCRADKWPQRDLDQLAVFFSKISFKSSMEWKEEFVLFDPQKDPSNIVENAVFPDGTMVTLTHNIDPRIIFANWLTSTNNPWFTKNIANRIWFWLIGCGIINEPDDIRPDNPPSHPELLDYLESELQAAHFDLKHLFRLILNSQVYQLSPVPKANYNDAINNFACYRARQLDAEVLIDAICQITGTSESYTSQIPEPFTFIPQGYRAVNLGDGSIGSPFLEIFGKPARDTGYESERNNTPTAAQRLHMLNSSHIQKKIEQGPKINSLLRSGSNRNEILKNIYLTILSRPPTYSEIQNFHQYANKFGRAGQRTAFMDLIWALMNSPEFLFRH